LKDWYYSKEEVSVLCADAIRLTLSVLVGDNNDELFVIDNSNYGPQVYRVELRYENCEPGWYRYEENGMFTCFPCLPGTYKQGIGSHACVQCMEGTYAGLASSSCVQCPDNSVSGVGSVSISDCVCLWGHHRVADTCLECRAGTYSDTMNATVCVQCVNNTYSDTNASTYCKTCPVYSSALNGASNINDCKCNATSELTSNGVCKPCLMPTNSWGLFYKGDNECDIICYRGAYKKHGLGGQCFPLPRRLGSFSSYEITDIKTDAYNKTLLLAGRISISRHQHPVLILRNSTLDPYGVLSSQYNNPCVLHNSLCCLWDVREKYVVSTQLDFLDSLNMSLCHTRDVSETLLGLIFKKPVLSVGSLIEWRISSDRQSFDIHIDVGRWNESGVVSCYVENHLKRCRLDFGVVFVSYTMKHGANMKLQQNSLLVTESGTTSMTVTKTQDHSCMHGVSTDVYIMQDNGVVSNWSVSVDVILKNVNNSHRQINHREVVMFRHVFGENFNFVLVYRNGTVMPTGYTKELSLYENEVYGFRVDVYPSLSYYEELGVYSHYFVDTVVLTETCTDYIRVKGVLRDTVIRSKELVRTNSFTNIRLWCLFGMMHHREFKEVYDVGGEGVVMVQHAYGSYVLLTMDIHVVHSYETPWVEDLYVIHIQSGDFQESIITELDAVLKNHETLKNHSELERVCRYKYQRNCLLTYVVQQHVVIHPENYAVIEYGQCAEGSLQTNAAKKLVRDTISAASGYSESLVENHIDQLCSVIWDHKVSINIVGMPRPVWDNMKISYPDSDERDVMIVYSKLNSV
jgi:hypothetical protein